MASLRACDLEGIALDQGAHLVGIASADALNRHPPDPSLPQTPERIWPECRSVVAIAHRIPAGAFRAQSDACVHHTDQLVLRHQDKVAYRIARALERQGFSAVPLNAQETMWSDSHGAGYGYLSTRHVAVEAGLGTLGLDMNLLTPEFGPRCYVTAILTDAAVETGGRMDRQVCIGETCSRCLYACPVDAVGHWNLDRHACACKAQEYGYLQWLWIGGVLSRGKAKQKVAPRLSSPLVFGLWQGLLRCVGAFGDCPRCLAVCPVGDDYFQFLERDQWEIPEKTDCNVETAAGWHRLAELGEPVEALSEGRERWIGEAGYSPPPKLRR